MADPPPPRPTAPTTVAGKALGSCRNADRMTSVPSSRPLSCRPGGAAWALPADETIAAVARTNAAEEFGALGVTGEPAEDVEVMVSEIATNALQHAARSSGGVMGSAPALELWMYRRLSADGHELVVSVFDQSCEPPRRSPCGAADLTAEDGRGLMLVEALSNGRWGFYATRSRLANPVVRGKATWFAVPLPARPDGFAPAAWEHDEAEAVTALKTLLALRGFDNLILQSRSEPGSRLAVLSVVTGLTVWCQDGHFRWDGPRGRRRLPLADLTAAAEAIVALHESTGLDGTAA